MSLLLGTNVTRSLWNDAVSLDRNNAAVFDAPELGDVVPRGSSLDNVGVAGAAAGKLQSATGAGGDDAGQDGAAAAASSSTPTSPAKKVMATIAFGQTSFADLRRQERLSLPASAAAAPDSIFTLLDGAKPFERLTTLERTPEIKEGALAKALKAAPKQPSQEELSRTMKLRVSVKSGADAWSFVPIEVKRSATVGDVIEEVLRRSVRVVFRSKDPALYELLLADADGQPDEDFAVALGVGQRVVRFGSTTFALLKKKGVAGGGDGGDEEATAKYEVASRYGERFNEYRVLRVSMPDGSHAHLSYKPDMTLNKVLVTVCSKRGMPATEMTLVNVDTLDEFDLRAKLADIELGVVRVVRKHELRRLRDEHAASMKAAKGRNQGPSLHDQARTGPLFIITPTIAAQYKTYKVVKINPYGQRQWRTMGIDAHHITNFVADNGADDDEQLESSSSSSSVTTRARRGTVSGETGERLQKQRDASAASSSGGSGFFFMRRRKTDKARDDKELAGTKNPKRPISDVKECGLAPEKSPHAFYITYTDKRIDYESKYADEIVTKINVLLSSEMHIV